MIPLSILTLAWIAKLIHQLTCTGTAKDKTNVPFVAYAFIPVWFLVGGATLAYAGYLLLRYAVAPALGYPTN